MNHDVVSISLCTYRKFKIQKNDAHIYYMKIVRRCSAWQHGQHGLVHGTVLEIE